MPPPAAPQPDAEAGGSTPPAAETAQERRGPSALLWQRTRQAVGSAWQVILSLFESLLRGYAALVFLEGTRVGLVMFAVSWLNPRSALLGAFAVLVAFAFAELVGIRAVFQEVPAYTYNPLLVGLGLGSILGLFWPTFVLTIGGSIAGFVLTVAASNVLRKYFSLPVLSVPFVCLSAVMYAASTRYGSLLGPPEVVLKMATGEWGLPLPVAGFLRSLGAIIYLPYAPVVLLLSLLLLVRSRILFALAIWGYFVGTGIRAMTLGSIAAF